MKNFKKYLLLPALIFAVVSCTNEDENPVANSVLLNFNNTFDATTIVLGDATATTATRKTSAAGQLHHFSEVKYVISNIRLIKVDGTEVPYNVNNLDKGATVIDQSKVASLNYLMSNIPVGSYAKIKFGLGVKQGLNVLDQLKSPGFYALAGANDTKMMWEWGTGYRFTKLEGFYGEDNKQLSIHTGSTLEDDDDNKPALKQGVDAYRDITLDLITPAVVGKNAPIISIKADFNKLLSGTTTITLSTGTSGKDNATPNIHTAVQMVKFVDNLAGNGTTDLKGMFSITGVQN